MEEQEDKKKKRKGKPWSYKRRMERVHVKVRTLDVVQPERNFLKYYRVLKYYMKAKHGLTDQDLEMLFFLLDENLFSSQTFKEYNKIFPWDDGRFRSLLSRGWIMKWRKEGMDKNRWALYKVSKKGKKALSLFYKMLNGEMDIPMDPNINVLLKEDGFVYRTVATEMKRIQKQKKKERTTLVCARRDGVR